MHTRRGYIQKPCRRHGYNKKKGCYYCHRRDLLGKYTTNPKLSREAQLLHDIFMDMDGGRFYTIRKCRHRKVKPPRYRRCITPPGPVASWTDGSSVDLSGCGVVMG